MFTAVVHRCACWIQNVMKCLILKRAGFMTICYKIECCCLFLYSVLLYTRLHHVWPPFLFQFSVYRHTAVSYFLVYFAPSILHHVYAGPLRPLPRQRSDSDFLVLFEWKEVLFTDMTQAAVKPFGQSRYTKSTLSARNRKNVWPLCFSW